MSVPLHIACGDYDRTRALLDGSVRPDGIELSYSAMSPVEAFTRFIGNGEFDASEMSLSNLMTFASRGSNEYMAIPVFLSRVFRHGFIFVNNRSGIEHPADLAGMRVGVFEYTMTAAVWIRAVLQHEYGIYANQLRWYTGGMDTPGRNPWISADPPADVSIESIPHDRELGEMLARGELDALFAASVPEVVKQGSSSISRLFPDHRTTEEAYFRKTGLVHLMHTFVLRSSVYQEHPWMARSLYDAFVEAKERGLRWLQSTGAPKVGLVWLQSYLESERAIFGQDHWPYGVEANRKSLEALATYVHEQGLTDKLVSIDHIFAQEIRSS